MIEEERAAGKKQYQFFQELSKPEAGSFEEERILLGSYPATEISYTVFHLRSGEYRRVANIFEEEHNFQIVIVVSPFSKLREGEYLSTIEKSLSTFKFISPLER